MPNVEKKTTGPGAASRQHAGSPTNPSAPGAKNDPSIAETLKKKVSETASDISKGASGAAASAGEAVSDAASLTREYANEAMDYAGDAYDAGRAAAKKGMRQVRRTSSDVSQNVEAYFEENPLMIGVFGFVGGLLLGSLLPRTRPEDRNFGQYRNDLARRGLQEGRDLSWRARRYAEENLANARRNLEREMDEVASDRASANNTFGTPAGHP